MPKYTRAAPRALWRFDPMTGERLRPADESEQAAPNPPEPSPEERAERNRLLSDTLTRLVADDAQARAARQPVVDTPPQPPEAIAATSSAGPAPVAPSEPAAAAPPGALIVDPEMAALACRAAPRLRDTAEARARFAAAMMRSGQALADVLDAVHYVTRRPLSETRSPEGRTKLRSIRAALDASITDWDTLAAAFQGTHLELVVRGTEDQPRLYIECHLLDGAAIVLRALDRGPAAGERARRLLLLFRGMLTPGGLALRGLVNRFIGGLSAPLASMGLGALQCAGRDIATARQ